MQNDQPARSQRLACKLCQWLGKRFSNSDESICSPMWRELGEWEHAYLSAIDGFGEEPDASAQLVDSAFDLRDRDPEGALALFQEAAAAGSASAIEMVGWHHEVGEILELDLGAAERSYHQAICAGSWSATLRYAKLLARRGDVAECENVLRDGVELDFVPAFFWLAWYRYKWVPTRATARDIRPLLERAEGRGHPIARKFLAGLMLRGKFGIRHIPDGLRIILDDDTRPKLGAAGAVSGTPVAAG